MQLAAAHRDPPADPAQPVAGRNGRMSANSVPAPSRAGPVGADQPERPRRRGARVERRGRAAAPAARRRAAHRPPAVAGPRRGQRDQLLAEQPPAPPAWADLDDRRPSSSEPAGQPVRRVHGDVRRLGGRPGDVLDVLGVGSITQPRGGALALVQRPVVQPVRTSRARTSGRCSSANAAYEDERRPEHHHRRLAGEHGRRHATTAPTTGAPGSAPGSARQVTGHRVSRVAGRRHLAEHRVDDRAARWSGSSRAPAAA